MSDVGILVSPEDIATNKSRVILDYTSRDFSAIRAQLVGMAKGFMPEWSTVGEAADFGTLLLELFSYMGDVLHFYIDRTSSEAFLGTAIRRQSVLYIADMLGYIPIGQQAATVRLQFSMAAEAEFGVVLPKGTRIHNNPDSADLLAIFELDQDVMINPGQTDIEGFATEGITQYDSLLGTSQGAPNADFVITDKGVVFGSVSLKSREVGRLVPWTFVSELSLARATQSAFTVFVDDQDLTHLIFGDNASGRIPPVNAELFVTYRYGIGAEANDLAPNTLTVIVPPANVDVWAVSVANPDKPLGGTDPESVESMRYSIPRAAGRIKNRAVTLNDYSDLALQVPGVAKSVAHGAVYTAIYIRIAPVDGQGDDVYMERLCSAVESYLEDKVMVGSTVYAEPRHLDVIWRPIFIQILIHVSEGYNRTQVRQAVEGAIRNMLSFNSVDFGSSVTIGQVYRIALAVQGVEWAELTYLDDSDPTQSEGGVQTNETDLIWTHQWQYNNNPDTTTDPGARHLRSATDSTSLAFNITTNNNVNAAGNLALIQPGDHLWMRNATNSTLWVQFVATAAAINHTTYFSVSTIVTGQSPGWVWPNNNTILTVNLVRMTPVVQVVEVADVLSSEADGTNLMIPRIETTEVIEDELNYPEMSEDERTHDGLWVRAVGGLINT